MKLFSCQVRLGGSLYNIVPKPDVTAAEIHILRLLHGDDSVVDIFETGKNKTTQAEERERLIEVYGQGLVANQKNKTSPAQALSEIFGIGGRLPDDIPGAPKKAKSEEKPAVVEPETDPAEE